MVVFYRGKQGDLQFFVLHSLLNELADDRGQELGGLFVCREVLEEVCACSLGTNENVGIWGAPLSSLSCAEGDDGGGRPRCEADGGPTVSKRRLRFCFHLSGRKVLITNMHLDLGKCFLPHAVVELRWDVAEGTEEPFAWCGVCADGKNVTCKSDNRHCLHSWTPEDFEPIRQWTRVRGFVPR